MDYNFIDQISCDKEDWTLKVRIVRMWDAINSKNNDLINVDMILVDEKAFSAAVGIAIWYPYPCHVFASCEGFIEVSGGGRHRDLIAVSRSQDFGVGSGEMGDPTPSNPTCRLCSGPLSKDMETSSWNVAPLIRDSFSMIGTAVGGSTSAFYGFNHVMPIVRRCVTGPMWLHFFIGAPPVIVFSSACAGLAGGALPALAQLVSSSYNAAMSS
ncbi:hypothetical protein Cni_G25148 [Canna indica]|uniref:Replication protein A 70 kDa DNA-binding subunit B/D first OB fold domain-containing protein n=1 Tax=Canna indica TaxID=4628 RepID=A0AAQ3L1D7_9LILI|nr:hypothetical protein Cni_G25148 [Canna indica]